MLNPGSTRGAVSDQFYRWTSGQVYSCPGDCPAGEFDHMDPAVCARIVDEAKPAAPQVHTTSIDANDIETRPATAKRKPAKS